MNIETYINLIIAISSTCAVIVALGVSIIPPIWRRHKNRKYAERRIYLSLTIIRKAILDYRLYNPTEYFFNDGEIHISYSTEELKIDVNIDINKEIDDILRFIDSLKLKNKISVWSVVEILKTVISGFPQEKKIWEKLETLLNKVIQDIPIKNN